MFDINPRLYNYVIDWLLLFSKVFLIHYVKYYTCYYFVPLMTFKFDQTLQSTFRLEHGPNTHT